jgi:predicted dehydrogenase
VNPLKNELQSFIDAIYQKTPVAVSAEDGLEALRLANTVLKQITLHQQKLIQISA